MYPVELTPGVATVLPFYDNTLSAAHVFHIYPTVAGAGRAIALDLREDVKAKINNVSATQFSYIRI